MTQFWVSGRLGVKEAHTLTLFQCSIRSSTTSPDKSRTSPGHCPCTTWFSPFCRPSSSVSLINSSPPESWTVTLSSTPSVRRMCSLRKPPSGFGSRTRCTTVWYIRIDFTKFRTLITILSKGHVWVLNHPILGRSQAIERLRFWSLVLGNHTVSYRSAHSVGEGRLGFRVSFYLHRL